ncbi:MAG: dynamin family protein [Planctomycetaceae bacterium]|jgi:signal recognition particle receptor subunit beta|nr:dynamin family protein [Planctomycetaceae bacterium]
MSKSIDARDRLRQCWNLFCDVARSEGRSELESRFEGEVKRIELGLFRIVIMGEIKKGKTSFINALLGAADLLPVESDIATSVVFKVMYAPERKFKIFFKPDIDTGNRREPLEVAQNQLRDYGTESGNPRNEKNVDFIGVEEPNPMLSEGIVIVDTPGVGGLFKAHRDVSWRYAPNADAIFFVLDSAESVMSSDEVNFLKELRDKLKKQVFFVQTKIDAVDTEQWETWRDRNKNILQKEVNISATNIKYFPISSNLKNIADESHDGELLQVSGFVELLDFIHRGLKAKKDEFLATQIISSIAIPANEIYLDLQSKQKLLSAKNNTEITKIKEDLDKAKSNLNQWERETFQPEMNRFREQFDDIKRKYRRIIQEELDPNGSVQEFIQNLQGMEALKSRTLEGKVKDVFVPNTLIEKAKELQDIWFYRTADSFSEIHAKYNSEVTELVESVSTKLVDKTTTLFSTDIVLSDDQSINSSLISNNNKIYAHFGLFENATKSLYGGTAASVMTYIGVSIASIFFPPAAALATIAPLIGFGLGGFLAGKDLQQKHHEEIFNKLRQNIQSLAARVLRDTLNHLDDMNVKYDRKINELFKSIVEDSRKRIESQSEQTRLALTQTKEENEKNLNEIKQRIAKVDTLLKLMKTFLTQKNTNR